MMMKKTLYNPVDKSEYSRISEIHHSLSTRALLC